MGRYRDHRDPRRHRHEDDSVSFSERASEPSYFQRPATVTADPIDAEIVWFNAGKGFGFVKLSDGTEAYLHIRVLEAAGSPHVSEGTSLKVVVEQGSRGRQVVQVLEISDPIAQTPSHRGRTDEPVATTSEQGATVKWYNPEKGFGFVAPENGEKHVFVHATALTRAGLRELVEGQKVFIECGQGKKGPEVRSIRLA